MKVGDFFETPEMILSSEEIIDFARLWDPQPFHLSEEAAKLTPFGSLFGSGLQSLCVMVKLGAEGGFLTKDSIAGIAIENLRFRSPLRPGARIYSQFRVREARPSGKNASRIVATINATLKQVDGPDIITADLINLYTAGPR
ncbi:MaoC-like hydratase protein (plasmid) [Rhizobium etli bv. mimosae str. Mim1]|nr:MaoC-like hydratase protein [Rhizobium etli bv. mimosae str. Mim1]